MSDKKMSFLPEDYVERRIERRTNLVCLAMFVLVLGGVVAVCLAKNRELSWASGLLREVDNTYTEAARRIEQLDALQQHKAEMLRKAQVTAMLLEKVPRSYLLADLINRMPEPISLLELQVDTKVLQAPARPAKSSALANKDAKDKEKGKERDEPAMPKSAVSLILIGVAPTDEQVAQYMTKLSQSPLLSEVNMIFTEEIKITDTTMRRFRIEMTLSDTADVRAMQPASDPVKPRNPLQDDAELPRITGAAPPVGFEDAGPTKPRRNNDKPLRAED